MKLSLVTIATFGLISRSSAIPLQGITDIQSLIERAHGVYDLVDRDSGVIEARTGPFARTNAQVRKDSQELIDSNNGFVAIAGATEPSHQTKTFLSHGGFHIDRQQPTNAHGDHKVAIQLNAGHPSTIGQVVVNKHANVSPKRVSATLKHSVNVGHEVRAPGSKKAGRIAANNAKHVAKKQRNDAKHAAGMERARKGIFKKGRK